MVLDVTALYGLMRAINNLSSPPLYSPHGPLELALDIVQGHVGKKGRKSLLLVSLDCLAQLLGLKVTPSGLYCFPRKLS